ERRRARASAADVSARRDPGKGHRVKAFWMPLALTAVAALAGVRGSTAAEPQPAGLLQTYQPVLFFHADEDWAPSTVESYLATARVERQAVSGVWTKVPPPLPTSTVGCTLTPCFRLNLPCALRSGYSCYQQQAKKTTRWDRPVVYGTVTAV